jgi:hypothetical protein
VNLELPVLSASSNTGLPKLKRYLCRLKKSRQPVQQWVPSSSPALALSASKNQNSSIFGRFKVSASEVQHLQKLFIFQSYRNKTLKSLQTLKASETRTPESQHLKICILSCSPPGLIRSQNLQLRTVTGLQLFSPELAAASAGERSSSGTPAARA